MKITYYVHDLSFPLREGIRKQTWWLAQAMKKQGHTVEIVSTSKNNQTIQKEGIKIRYGSPWHIRNVKTDILHYITHPTPLIVPLLLNAKAKKQILTMFDGNLNSFWKRPWDFFVSWLVNKKINMITLQTEYQKRLLNYTRIKKQTELILPLIPSLTKKQKSLKNPNILFMSHFHPLKGIYETLKAYQELKQQIPSLTLTIANSAITEQKNVIKKIKSLNDPRIILKGTVDPQKELAKASVYVYPIQNPQETFSIPLSLIEAIQTKTPWVATDVGSLREFFDNNYLVSKGNVHELATLIKRAITKKQVGKMLKKIDNKKVINQFEELYKK